MAAKVVTLEGNVGAGKSTVLRELARLGFHTLPEPVDEWVSSGALRDFYSGAMDAFTFQTYVLETRHAALARALAGLPDGATLVMERGFVADSRVFMRHGVETGAATERQAQVYERLSAALTATLPCEFAGVAYLRASPAECLARARRRARAGEEAISAEHLEALGALYDRAMSGVPGVVVVGADGPPEVVAEYVARAVTHC